MQIDCQFGSNPAIGSDKGYGTISLTYREIFLHLNMIKRNACFCVYFT